jgi:hypothetical protein
MLINCFNIIDFYVNLCSSVFLAVLFGFFSFLFVPARLVLMVHCIAHVIVCPERLVTQCTYLHQPSMLMCVFSPCMQTY